MWHDISKTMSSLIQKSYKTLRRKRKFQNKFHVIITNMRCNIVIEYSDTEEGVKEIKHNQAFSN